MNNQVSGTSRRYISTLRRQFCHSLERRDVGYQRRDIGFIASLERRDVRSQRRDVSFAPLWKVATFDPNIAALDL